MVKEKYLVVLGGSPRGGEKAWSSMYKYVKNHLKAYHPSQFKMI